jgi:hypothetical protein
MFAAGGVEVLAGRLGKPAPQVRRPVLGQFGVHLDLDLLAELP